MGNKLGKKRQAVEEKYTRPQGLYQNPDVDNKKLRKLILKSRLAPCYPGDEEGFNGLEECPICFLYYPSLNRSRCCAKGICTECFLQMKPSRSTRSTQCPFCKRFQYSVDYRGMRTEEEKEMEQIEEQKVIEARVRMRQKERIEEEERVERRRAVGVSSEIVRSGGGEPRELPSTSTSAQHGGIVPSNASPSLPATRRLLQPRQNRTDDFDLDLEHLMFMEAIWRSIQESGPHLGGPAPLGQSSSTHVSPAGSREAHSPSGGLACAVASMAERQLTDGITNAVAPPPPPHLLAEEHSPVPGRGDSFDEQMMLAMALSLADARSTRSSSDAGDW